MHLLSLPYDIRHLIYSHLFPPDQQIHVHVVQGTLYAIIPRHRIPVELLLTCRGLYEEASEYLYNNYLFNIVGRKSDCLAAYEKFLRTVKRHARENADVHVDAFSNGSHSATMCISIQLVGEARMDMLKQRKRGEPKSIQELEQEVAMTSKAPFAMRLLQSVFEVFPLELVLAIIPVLGFLLAWSAAMSLES